MLKPKREWASKRTKAELVQAISDELAAFPGMSPAFSQPISLRVNELISGIKSDVAIKIFGDDMGLLQETAEKIAPILSNVRGSKDIKIEQVSGFSQIEVQMDRELMAKAMINAEDINALIETAVGGKVVTTVFEGQKRFAVLVRFPLKARKDTAALERLLVPSPLGYSVPLGDLAVLREVDVPAQISREDSMRRLIVECNVRGRDMGGFVEEAQQKLADLEKGLPNGYGLRWGGQFENQLRAMKRLKLVVPVSLLLVLVMLACSLGSIKSALLVLVNLPFAVVGGILAIFFLGIHLSVSASIGFIALLGVAVENGLVLVSFFDQLRRRGKNVNDAVLEACRLRARPLLMTSLTTVMGLFPILIATGAGSEIQRPLVAVVFGGLISSLALTLVILPALYCLVESDSPRAADKNG